MAELSQVIADAQTLTPDQQQQVRASLPAPSGSGLSNVWYILLGGLILIALVALVSAVFLVNKGKTADAAWAVVTAVIGGLVGLLAPSPAQSASQ